MSSGWRITPLDSVKNSSIYHHMPSGWLSWSWYHILMSYDNVITSSRYNTLPFVGHPNEIANFGCSQHAVVIQHFLRFVPCPESNSLFLIWPPEILSIAAVLYWLADAFNEKFYCRLTTVKFEKKKTLGLFFNNNLSKQTALTQCCIAGIRLDFGVKGNRNDLHVCPLLPGLKSCNLYRWHPFCVSVSQFYSINARILWILQYYIPCKRCWEFLLSFVGAPVWSQKQWQS